MSKTQLLKAFVNDRLAAAAVEILRVFDITIAEYENEAFRSKQEIERQRRLLDHLALKPQSDISLFPVCEEETPPEQQQYEQDWIPSLGQAEPEPPHIKEEQQELWTSQGGEQLKEPDEEADIMQFVLPSPAAKSDCDRDPTPSLQPQIQRSETATETLSGGSQASVSILNALESKKTRILKRQRSGISCKSKRSLESTHLKTPNFCCKVCGKTFQYKGFLLKHLRQTHTEEKEVVCGVCGESFESPESLTGHLNTHNDKYVCHICGMCFAKKNILMAHMTCHREVKLHHCHVCGRECSRKSDLKIHMRIHTGEKPYCCSYCSKSFTHSGHLKKHIRSHTGERLYRCQVCDKGFTQTSRLVRHMTFHSECRPNQQFNLSSVN